MRKVIIIPPAPESFGYTYRLYFCGNDDQAADPIKTDLVRKMLEMAFD